MPHRRLYSILKLFGLLDTDPAGRSDGDILVFDAASGTYQHRPGGGGGPGFVANIVGFPSLEQDVEASLASIGSVGHISHATDTLRWFRDNGVTLDQIIGTLAQQDADSVVLTGNLDVGGFRITNMAEPVAGSDAATRTFVESTAEGLNGKGVVRFLGDTNKALTALQTIDSVVGVADDLVLLTGQTDASENGSWIMKVGAWVRPANFAAGSSARNSFWFVSEGTVFADTRFWVTTDKPNDVVDTDNLVVVQFSGAAEITDGDGIDKVGNTLSVDGTVSRTGHTHDASEITAGTFDPGTFSWAGSTITTIGIVQGGTIDGTVVGGVTPAAATFTTLATTGLASLDELELLLGADQNYKFTKRAGNNILAFEGQSAAAAAIFEYFSKDGDSSDAVSSRIYGLGTVASIVNFERLETTWNPATSRFEISSQADGTGTVQPLMIQAGILGNLTIGTDGSIMLRFGATVDELSTDGTFAGDSDDAVPTEKAVKTFVDTRPITVSEGIQAGVSPTLGTHSFKLDVGGLTEETDIDPANDFIPFFDDSAGLHRKMKPPLSGGMPIVATANITSSVATVDIINLDDSFDEYIFRLINLVPVNDAVSLQMRVSTDNGSSFKTGASDYKHASRGKQSNGNNLDASSDAATSIFLTDDSQFVGSASGEGVDGNVRLYNPANAAQFPRIFRDTVWSSDNDRLSFVAGGGQYNTAEAINAVRFFFSAGNIESGKIVVYGVKLS